ncbi:MULTISPECIES: fructose-bisphosphatase class III [unclassified Lentimonas]|uniref:fructose-bisphosphatase class III n=1 Tax=unclassified Lentimonas TaxID=2630993 RepID=UPI00132BD65A|nr:MULTISPECIES: fructose-bisphosphatase class III [unclassified Lentimonas]CAA6679182.1 Fructose-1,6-bisphosphatase, Bacillus type (EC [Lentimonas sp. CC4]CAA6684074.1 Fructose-1,6-bisphosphatase, Bacillus type (EC [Lentimonas sp. CC6]CAA7076550.1 Fructose-1,6-bisphosphatase, Bacillus type (EC [Lentimonas sp. CC4]CAA7171676.1 Fructose-1,6-bisphosphatase, Bacillus type (EC [Lentimonas sp. CC21]CAA7183053.1 Fructose-1,6-bisphosphatase, Bacillus type (EC [Lentimonas sp. CC8]
MTNKALSFKRPEENLSSLELLAAEFSNTDAAIAEIARLAAVQTLPRGAIHMISDIHGEDKKLRHVINNASGTLRPLVEKMFAKKMTSEELKSFLKITFYPAEVTDQLERDLTDPFELKEYARKILNPQFELLRHLMGNYSLKLATEILPADYQNLLLEILHAPTRERGNQFVEAIIDELQRQGRVLHLIHIVGRLIRNLAVDELIIGGDCWDRGPRGDRVVDYLRLQPNVSFIWGNHDALWLGAALGNDALICTALRVSLRYRRISQLDEGYSVPMTPLEHLARKIYSDDPAEFFMPKGDGLRPIELVARMQKAIAVMQFKLEGQLIERNPQWKLDHRRLMHRIDLDHGTIEIDGVVYELRDKRLPTVDPEDPYTLTSEEQDCLDRLKSSFLSSQKMREQMRYMVGHGSMYLQRGDCLIFHGCVPVDTEGNFLDLEIDGQNFSGKALFEEIEVVVRRALEKRKTPDLDFLWYLWCGPRSPLFGKDRIATLERDLIADKTPHRENKDPYFDLIHEVGFCDKVLEEFGADADQGLIVNGHVPVKLKQGESPIKRSGKAITIDGAFSEAYGDHGYTLVLEPGRIVLAEHHHFESIESAIKDGVDIVPKTQDIRVFDDPQRTQDTERGQRINYRMKELNRLIEAYRSNRLHEQ